MTGYGLAEKTIGAYEISVEVKALNAKFADVNLKMPQQLASNELAWRKQVSNALERGKIAVTIDVNSQNNTDILLDQAQFEAYKNRYTQMAKGLQISDGELFKLALQTPGVFKSASSIELPSEVVAHIPLMLTEAIQACDVFRCQEGKQLAEKLAEYAQAIKANLDSIELLDAQRTERVAERLKQALENLGLEMEVDKNRFEQELIYYIEKFDINEEKVRLNNHLTYLHEVLGLTGAIGKKLGFVSQEIGREINTIGSKANDSDIQKHVVAMKEELEKIKEQSLNIL